MCKIFVRTTFLRFCSLAVGVLLLTSCGIHQVEPQYDKFYPYDLTLESPKTNYLVGDKIELVASVVSNNPDTIRVYKDRTKSFTLFIRTAIGTSVDFADNDFNGPSPNATANDTIEVIKISPGNPFRLKLQGQVTQTKSKQIIFNFGKFGTFNKSGPGNFLVSGYWRPISPDYIDSLEDYADSIILKVTLPNK